MAEAFDPYYIWLGIPSEEQPADHYRLLGVRRFESHDEVIANAADQRVRHLRSMQTGKRQAETQKLLNEISAASGTLLNPDKRKEYDAKLKAKEAAKEAAKQPAAKPVPTARAMPVAAALPAAHPAPAAKPPVAAAPSAPPQPFVADFSRPAPKQRPKSSLVPLIAVGGVGLALVAIAAVVGGVAFFGFGKQAETVVLPPEPPIPAKTGGDAKVPTPKVEVPPVTPATTGVPLPSPPIAAPRWLEGYTFEGQTPKSLLREGTKRYVGGAEMPALTSPILMLENIPQAAEGRHGVGFDVTPPSAYVLTVLLDQVQGDGLAIDVPVFGNVARIVIDDVHEVDGKKTYASGFELIGDKHLKDRTGSTVTRGKLLADRGPHQVTISVAMNRVCAAVSTGNQLKYFCNYESDPKKYRLGGGFYPWFGQNRIGISTRGKLALQDVMLIHQVQKGAIAASPPTTPGSSSSNPTPPKNLNVRIGKPVDILREARILQAAGAELKDGKLLTSIRQRQLAMMVFDHIPSGEYMLDATITRTGGKDGIQFAITVDGRPGSVALDCFVDEGRGPHSGLELIDGQRLTQPNYPALHKGEVLTNGKPAKVQILVRKGNVVLQVDGRILVDWKGDSARLSRMPVTLSEAGPRLAIGTWQSTYTVESLKVYPILDSGGTDLAGQNPASSQPSEGFEVKTKDGRTLSVKALQKTNLLRGIARSNIVGDLSPRGGMKGIVSAGNDPDRAEFQFPLPAEYMLETRFARLNGNDAIVLGLLVGGRPTSIVVDGFSNQGHFSGLERIGGKRLDAGDHPSAIKGRQLTNGRKSSLRVIVQPGRVIADLDGKRIADWAGDAAALDRDSSHATPDFRNLSVGTWSRSSYHIESLEVAPIQVTEKSRPPRLPVPDGPALAKAREKLKETFGDWEQKGKKPDEKLKLSQEFVSVANSEKDAAVRYVLLDSARSLAAAGQDMATAASLAQSVSDQYEIDTGQLKLETLKLAGGAALPVSEWESAAELAAELASDAQHNGKLELADAASQLAAAHASHSKNAELKKSVKQLRDAVTAQLKFWEVAKAGEKTLETMPDDPAANLAVGKWYCLHAGDWDKGIPRLAKSGDAKLAAAAAAERDALPLPAADAWSAASAALSGGEKLAAQKRALELYQDASEKLTGLEQLKAAKRVTEMTDLVSQSESLLPTIGKTTPRTKPATGELRPGLLVRVYAGQPPDVPTPSLGVIHSYSDFAVRREQLVRELRPASQRLTFAGVGYIDLDKDEAITFNIRNGVCFVDGNRVLSNSPEGPAKTGSKKKGKNPDQVKKLVKRGRHTVEILPFDAAFDGPEFQISRADGSNAISYSPADLEDQLARPVLHRGMSVREDSRWEFAEACLSFFVAMHLPCASYYKCGNPSRAAKKMSATKNTRNHKNSRQFSV